MTHNYSAVVKGPQPPLERCIRCSKWTYAFCTFTTNIVEKYGYYVEREVRWCYPCAYDWKIMFWKQPPDEFKLGREE